MNQPTEPTPSVPASQEPNDYACPYCKPSFIGKCPYHPSTPVVPVEPTRPNEEFLTLKDFPRKFRAIARSLSQARDCDHSLEVHAMADMLQASIDAALTQPVYSGHYSVVCHKHEISAPSGVSREPISAEQIARQFLWDEGDILFDENQRPLFAWEMTDLELGEYLVRILPKFAEAYAPKFAEAYAHSLTTRNEEK